MAVSEQILPCPNPWCEGLTDIEHREGGFFRVGCLCGVAGPASTDEQGAIKLWNEALAMRAAEQSRCPTCGTTDKAEMLHCSDGFHAQGPTYWPDEANDQSLSTDVVERVAMSLERISDVATWLDLNHPDSENIGLCAADLREQVDRISTAIMAIQGGQDG